MFPGEGIKANPEGKQMLCSFFATVLERRIFFCKNVILSFNIFHDRDLRDELCWKSEYRPLYELKGFLSCLKFYCSSDFCFN